MKIKCHLEYQSDGKNPDGTPILVDAGCGKEFEVADGDIIWDINTIIENGVEYVVEQHFAPLCPYCGRTADFISKGGMKIPFDEYLAKNKVH